MSSPDCNQDRWQKLDRAHRHRDFSDYARPLALRIVGLLRDSPVTSIHVTCLFIALGLLAAILISLGLPAGWLGAAGLLQAKNLLDAVDGSLARAQNKPSQLGRYLDSIGDFCVSCACMLAFAWLLIPRWGAAFALALGALCLLAMLLQGSYYNLFSVLAQRYRRRNVMSRLDEAAPLNKPECFAAPLQRLYLLLYGWQDRLVQSWVHWAHGHCDPSQSPALLKPRRLSWVSLLGLGCQLLLQALALLLHVLMPTGYVIEAYLFTTLFLGSALVLADLAYLRHRQLERTQD